MTIPQGTTHSFKHRVRHKNLEGILGHFKSYLFDKDVPYIKDY